MAHIVRAKQSETSLGKALRLLSAIGESTDPLGVSVSELLRVTGLSRPTIYRFLGELQASGMVSGDPRQPLWRLGPKVVALAAVAGNWAGLRRRARAAMEEFVAEVGHTVHLGIRDGFEIVYIDKAESARHLAISSAVGQRRPINVTALGKCLTAFDPNPQMARMVADAGLTRRTPASIVDPEAWLAEIARVRAEGIAHDNEECDPGARCVAAPIRDAHGFAVAAISISALVTRAELDFMQLASQLRAVAETIGMAQD